MLSSGEAIKPKVFGHGYQLNGYADAFGAKQAGILFTPVTSSLSKMKFSANSTRMRSKALTTSLCFQ